MKKSDWEKIVEAFQDLADDPGKNPEKPGLTLGQLLDLMDLFREGDEQIRVVGEAESYNEGGLTGPTSSDLWAPFEDCLVGTLGLEDGPRLVVCLDEDP